MLPLLLVAGLGCGSNDSPAADGSQPVRLDAGPLYHDGGDLPEASGRDGSRPVGMDGSAADASPVSDAGALGSDASSDAGGTMSVDAGSTCVSLTADYATALADAQSCDTDTDCVEQVCDGPCCNCQVYVSRGKAASLNARLEAFGMAGCFGMIACPDFFCPPPTGVHCVRNACMTERGAPPAAP